MTRIVLKLGGSIITKKSQDRLEVDHETLDRLAREIGESINGLELFIVHGAGPYGHVPAKHYGLEEGFKGAPSVKGFSVTHSNMEVLNFHVVDALMQADVNAIAFQPSAAGILKSQKIVSMDVAPVAQMMGLGLVPVGYGDVLVDEDTKVNILSGDHLVPYMAEKLAADRVVIATDYNGIYEGKPGESKRLELITRDDLDILAGRKTHGTDVTGGIKRKVTELLDLAEKGIPVEILSGREEDYVKNALHGVTGQGTIISKG
ncbi:isopentenyl phosphate kinase [Candidatus Altiarchaeota archaeon]